MADKSDRTTQDMFNAPKGRPKTSPLSREEQQAAANKKVREKKKSIGLSERRYSFDASTLEKIEQIKKAGGFSTLGEAVAEAINEYKINVE